MSADHVAGGFIRRWFDLLNAHPAVEKLLPYVSNTDLRMVFPEATLLSHADFRSWYEAVGLAYVDQTHVVQQLDASDRDDGTEVRLTVVWSATQRADGARLSSRVDQAWRLGDSPDTGEPIIREYHVLSIVNI
jgi:hypothetical protein